MDPTKQGIILIGMPGAGKSTVGVLLAKELGLGFIDTDLLIQSAKGRTLQEILDADGYMRLREIEEEVLLATQAQGHVIATGGSAVYSEPAMIHLAKDGTLIYLDVALEQLEARIDNYATRGIAKPAQQSFADLMQERGKLYLGYADIRIDCTDLTPGQVVQQIVSQLASR